MRYNIGLGVGHSSVWPLSVVQRQRRQFKPSQLPNDGDAECQGENVEYDGEDSDEDEFDDVVMNSDVEMNDDDDEGEIAREMYGPLHGMDMD